MSETLNKVKVNKISKERYDTLVESGVITPQMIKEEVWLFIDDQFVSEHDKEVWNSKPGEGAIPTKLSQLTNDTGFINKNVNNLTYYTKTNDLPPVARTGQYSDLSGIPAPITKVSQLDNDLGYITEEDIPHIPEYTSELTNDSGYVTDTEVDTKLTDYQPILVSGTNIKTINNSSLLGSGNIDISGGGGTWGTIGGTLSDQTDLQNALNAKQPTLISGTNIKTINNNSLLGNGNLDLRLDSWPIGCLYFSDRSTSPASLFGGTWEVINGYYIYVGNNYAKSNYTGKGTQGHTLTANQSGVREHSHSMGNAGSHQHEVYLNGDTSFPLVGYPGWNGGTTGNSMDMRTSRNGFRTYTGWDGDHSHTINNTSRDAGEAHSHDIATLEVYAWRRIA